MKKMFFYIFVFLLPWQTRFIFTPEKSEFLTFSIYLSEIFLWLALAFWLASADLKKTESRSEGQRPSATGVRVPNIFLFFSFFVFLSIFWSSDKVAAFRLWLFIFDGMMVYLFLREHENMRRGAKKIFLFSMLLAAIFGIWQFFNLGSGAFKWLGLAERGAWNLGDIVVEAGGGRWLRAYGPFPHPNIFGGYLAAGIVLLFGELKKITKCVRSYTFCYFYIVAAVLFFALFLTFSRSALIALIATAAYGFFYFLKIHGFTLSAAVAADNVKEGQKEILKFFIFLSLSAIIFSIVFFPFIRTRVESSGRLEEKSNIERVESWRDGFVAWKQNPIFGYGLSVIASGAKQSRDRHATSWLAMTEQKQPPHNIFILVLSQLGIAGLIIYLFIWKKFWKNTAARPFLIFFFVVGLFDHYLWTLYAGQMIFWFGLSILDRN